METKTILNESTHKYIKFPKDFYIVNQEYSVIPDRGRVGLDWKDKTEEREEGNEESTMEISLPQKRL